MDSQQNPDQDQNQFQQYGDENGQELDENTGAASGFLMFIAEVSELEPEDLEKLFYNGFDNLESLELCSIEDMQSLGVSDPEKVFNRIRDTIQVYKQMPPPQQDLDPIQEGEFEQEENQPFNEQSQNTMMGQQQDPYSQNIKQPDIKLPKDARCLSREILLGPVNLKKPPQFHRGILDEKTHLKMSQYKLSSVTSTNMEGQDEPILAVHCPNLQILYLQDNYLSKLGPHAFAGLKNLRQINLFSNYLTKMDCFDECFQLQKLYLEGNRLTRLEGLTSCTQLEELYLGNQITNVPFTFDDYSLAAISGSLTLLDLPQVKLVDSKPLYYLERLNTLNLRNNQILDFQQSIAPILMTLSSLQYLMLQGNPVQKTPKYRDQVVVLTRSLLELDGKQIKGNERAYLSQLNQRKATQYQNLARKQSLAAQGVTGGQQQQPQMQAPIAQVKGAPATKGNGGAPAMIGGIEGHKKSVYGQSHAQASANVKNQLTTREYELMKQYEAMKAQGRLDYQPYDTAKASEGEEFYSETNMTPFRTK